MDRYLRMISLLQIKDRDLNLKELGWMKACLIQMKMTIIIILLKILSDGIEIEDLKLI